MVSLPSRLAAWHPIPPFSNPSRSFARYDSTEKHREIYAVKSETVDEEEGVGGASIVVQMIAVQMITDGAVRYVFVDVEKGVEGGGDEQRRGEARAQRGGVSHSGGDRERGR
ncbi:hypothetical protein U1Q18_008454 [Sarracenia purpurea var. burkii]